MDIRISQLYLLVHGSVWKAGISDNMFYIQAIPPNFYEPDPRWNRIPMIFSDVPVFIADHYVHIAVSNPTVFLEQFLSYSSRGYAISKDEHSNYYDGIPISNDCS